MCRADEAIEKLKAAEEKYESTLNEQTSVLKDELETTKLERDQLLEKNEYLKNQLTEKERFSKSLHDILEKELEFRGKT